MPALQLALAKSIILQKVEKVVKSRLSDLMASPRNFATPILPVPTTLTSMMAGLAPTAATKKADLRVIPATIELETTPALAAGILSLCLITVIRIHRSDLLSSIDSTLSFSLWVSPWY